VTEHHRDHFGRTIDYLRISVTDRCNLRCVYCMPEEGVALQSHEKILRYEEIARLVRIAADLGVSRVRLTGGEPLVRANLVDLVRQIAEIPGIRDLSMTTNATLLARYAGQLAQAGLNRVNISLDTLRPERFRQITRCGSLEDTLAGIEAARQAGLAPIKINTVVVHGLNDDELVDMALRTRTEGWHVRFIELMPLGEGGCWAGDGYLPMIEVRERIEQALGELEPASLSGAGPARYWRIPGAEGTLGFISPISEHFCAECNRLRLTADGRLLPCMMADTEFDLRTPLRQGADDAALRELFLQTVAAKPARHHLCEHVVPRGRTMSQMGG